MFTLFIYTYQLPSKWQQFLISSYQFFGGYSHIVPCFVSTSLPPPQKTACSCCCYLYLAYFCPKVINCYSVCVMFADTMDSFNECEMAVCHDLHSAPDTLDTLVDGITFYATSSNSFGIYLCLASHPLVSFFYRLPKKNVTCSLQNIYFSYFCLLIISYNVHI